MNLQSIIKRIESSGELSVEQKNMYWQQSMSGNEVAKEKLTNYYMKLLHRIKPLYSSLTEENFYSVLESSVAKALERGIKFQVTEFDSYMIMASETYFKYQLQPVEDTIHLPSQLLRAFTRLEEIYQLIPDLKIKDDHKQIELLSIGLEYPIFSTRLLYFSYNKWKNNNLRQVDIDLTVNLLPEPKRIEWEVFYEKDIETIKNDIMKLI